ncbi:thermonuclease family protein [Candidatus Woesearchaeota archaeon]|nr:thermonuclease family protein [Candidatus Woesearchaeota archaeon]
MAAKPIFLIFFIVFISGCITGSAVRELEGPFLAVKVVDGDTLDLNDGSRIRMSGINTPETGECYYKEAKEKLAGLVLNKEVHLERDRSDKDKYGRLLRYIYLNESGNEILVNAVLVKGGYARVYDKYKSDTKRYGELKKVEEKAVENRLGVWGCVDNKKNCLYVGSKDSDKYHTPDCKFSKKIKPENLVCFYSIEDAEEDGREFSGC